MNVVTSLESGRECISKFAVTNTHDDMAGIVRYSWMVSEFPGVRRSWGASESHVKGEEMLVHAGMVTEVAAPNLIMHAKMTQNTLQ